MTTILVNGERRQVDADPAMPLLWALRDLLRLKGTKYSCGEGLCGACTIHLDGRPVQSCITPVSAAEGRSITTIEGLSADGSHPLQTLWTALNVSQCGYCQPGQLMSAAALLERHPNPTEEQIDEAMGGNLCRCGTYLRIREAIWQASRVTMGGGS